MFLIDYYWALIFFDLTEIFSDRTIFKNSLRMRVYVHLFNINLLSTHVELSTISTETKNKEVEDTSTSTICNASRCIGLKTLISFKSGNLCCTNANNVGNTGRYREQNRAFQKLFLYYAITNVKLYLPIQMLNFKYDITVLVTVQINGVQPVSTLRSSLSI